VAGIVPINEIKTHNKEQSSQTTPRRTQSKARATATSFGKKPVKPFHREMLV
jgi:hypothetical protein